MTKEEPAEVVLRIVVYRAGRKFGVQHGVLDGEHARDELTLVAPALFDSVLDKVFND